MCIYHHVTAVCVFFPMNVTEYFRNNCLGTPKLTHFSMFGSIFAFRFFTAQQDNNLPLNPRRLMQEACSREPYRPEDHQFTSATWCLLLTNGWNPSETMRFFLWKNLDVFPASSSPLGVWIL